MSDPSLYGPEQSRFARLLERRELRRPDPWRASFAGGC